MARGAAPRAIPESVTSERTAAEAVQSIDRGEFETTLGPARVACAPLDAAQEERRRKLSQLDETRSAVRGHVRGRCKAARSLRSRVGARIRGPLRARDAKSLARDHHRRDEEQAWAGKRSQQEVAR